MTPIPTPALTFPTAPDLAVEVVELEVLDAVPVEVPEEVALAEADEPVDEADAAELEALELEALELEALELEADPPLMAF